MGRKFILSEKELREMLYALMFHNMCERDGVDNWGWYGQSYDAVVRDFHPEDITLEDVRERNLEFDDCIDALLDSGAYQELLEATDTNIDLLIQAFNEREAIQASY